MLSLNMICIYVGNLVGSYKSSSILPRRDVYARRLASIASTFLTRNNIACFLSCETVLP
jgi:hypothetical protein